MTGTGSEPGATPTPDPVPVPAAAPVPEASTPGSVPNPQPAPTPGATPGPAPASVPWATAPPSPTRRYNTALIAAVTVAAVLLLAGIGVGGGFLLLRSAKTAASSPVSEAPLSPTTGGGPTASAEPAESEPPAPKGPAASADAATEIRDLNRVCDEDVYYPQSPKRAGKAPHPVVLLVADGMGGGDIRFQDGTYYYSEGLSKRAEQTWASENPKNVQMVACLDRVSTGSTIRRCKYDDPKPETVTLLRAGWRLRVYEVATGRKLLDKALKGDDQACPSVVMVYPDKKIYAEVSDRAAVGALRSLVNR
ncbi:hypothetical protein ABTX15_17610 [Micromonospora sp. NPDC094482]|uniref:hypothetical protein n=1 Tax=unclassified Micromonospora TaxID=2617518 RepID=UPI003333019B